LRIELQLKVPIDTMIITAVSALDKVVVKFRREGTEVEVIGLNEASATMVDKFAVHDKDGAEDMLMGH
jgi:SulP family sulfate permease